MDPRPGCRRPSALCRISAAAAALILTLAACSSPGANPSADGGGIPAESADPERPVVNDEVRQRVQQTMDTPLLADPGPDVGGLTAQRIALDDYVVTPAEYEQAMRASIACIEAEGFSVHSFGRGSEGAIRIIAAGVDPDLFFTWSYLADDRSGTALSDVEDRCRAQWSSWIESVWEMQNAPTEQERQAWLERAWACAREQGQHLSDPPTEGEALMATGGDCRPWEAG